MKAFLLAGGLGERLRPLTLTMPKCLVPVNGVPLLDIWLDLCARHGITDVLLNVSQHPHLVREHLRRRGSSLPRVELLIEAAPRGTAGSVAAGHEFVAGEPDFWIFYSDMLTDADLTALAEAHHRHDGVLTMGLFHAPVPTAVGIVDLAEDRRIRGFVEKPAHPVSDLANAGIYLARPELLTRIPRGSLVDFGHHVFPQLTGRMYGHVIEQFALDLGTPQALAAASRAWAMHVPARRSA
jgi:mannose-1-phosphate guanylyltransferase